MQRPQHAAPQRQAHSRRVKFDAILVRFLVFAHSEVSLVKCTLLAIANEVSADFYCSFNATSDRAAIHLLYPSEILLLSIK